MIQETEIVIGTETEIVKEKEIEIVKEIEIEEEDVPQLPQIIDLVEDQILQVEKKEIINMIEEQKIKKEMKDPLHKKIMKKKTLIIIMKIN